MTVDAQSRVIEDGVILIRDSRIEFVGREGIRAQHTAEREIDATGKTIFPGLINMHDHMFQSLMRFPAARDELQVPLLDWLKKRAWPVTSSLTAEELYVGELLSCVENITSGVTFVMDNLYGNRHFDLVGRAMQETKIRGCIARGFYEVNASDEVSEEGEEILESCERLIDTWHGAAGGKIMVAVAPMHPCFVSGQLLAKSKELADKRKVRYHVHTGESQADLELCRQLHGTTDIELMHQLGILSPSYLAVHSNWLTSSEIRHMAESGCSAVHNPQCNMLAATGNSPVPELRTNGVNIALGTDGSGGPNHDMIRFLKTAVLLHRSQSLDATVITTQDVLEMATINGARALGLEDQLGSIERGKKADIIIVDLEKLNIAPVHDPIEAFVLCACHRDVETVIIDGEVVMENREIKTANLDEILAAAIKTAHELRQRVGI